MMAATIKIIKAEITMLVGEIKQYYLNYIFYNLSILALYFGLFYNFFHNDSQEDVLAVLICLSLWQICSNAIQYLSYLIQDEAMMGTLEQIFLTKTGFVTILFSKVLVSMVFVILKGIVLFILCAILFGQTAILSTIGFGDYLIVILICVITAFTFYCIGGVFGGLSLYFKRISSLLNVIDYLLLFFTGIINSIQNYPLLLRILINLVPITQANTLIHQLCTQDYTASSFISFIIISLVYIFLGYVILARLINKAKNDGKLGQY